VVLSVLYSTFPVIVICARFCEIYVPSNKSNKNGRPSDALGYSAEGTSETWMLLER